MVLYLAEKRELVTKPGVKYFATFILGAILTALSYGIIALYRNLAGLAPLSSENNQIVLMILLLISFLIVFGYTFPERWFKQKNAQETRTRH